jgi:hypothetical protein
VKKFYASKDDFRNKERQLLCPFCGKRFIDKEAKEIIDYLERHKEITQKFATKI